MVNPDTKFRAAEVAQILNLTSGRVAKLGNVVRPVTVPMGSGHRAEYRFRDIVEVAMANEMATFGVPSRRTAQYLDQFSRSRAQVDWFAPENDRVWAILGSGQDWAIGMSLDAMWLLLGGGIKQWSAIVIDIGRIKLAIQQGIERLNEETKKGALTK